MVTVAHPPSAQPGDLLLATLGVGYFSNAVQPVITAQSGWSLVDRVNYMGETTLVIYYRIATATEPTMHAWTTDLEVQGSAWLVAVTGAHPTSPIDAIAGLMDTSNALTYSTPSVTTTAPGARLFASFVSHANTGAETTWMPPTGMSTLASLTDGDNYAGACATSFASQPGATGVRTATASQPQQYALSHLLAIRPP